MTDRGGRDQVEATEHVAHVGLRHGPHPLGLHVVAGVEERSHRERLARCDAVLGPAVAQVVAVIRERLGARGDQRGGGDDVPPLEGDLLDLGTRVGQHANRVLETRDGRQVVALEPRVVRAFDGDAQAVDRTRERGGVVGDGMMGRVGVGRIVAGDRLEDHRAVARGARHRPDGVEAPRQGHARGLRHPAERRLQAGDPAQRRWDADAAARVGAEAAVEETGRGAAPGSRARPPRPPVVVPRVAVDRERAGGVGRAHRELHRRGLAHDDGAVVAQTRDDRRVAALLPFGIEDAALGGGRPFAGRDDVLDTERDALERAAVDARREVGVGPSRRLERGVGEPAHVDAEHRIEPFGPLVHLGGELDARHRVGAQRGRGLGDGCRQQAHGWSCLPLSAASRPGRTSSSATGSGKGAGTIAGRYSAARGT